jgi:hypothetical protein
MDRRKFLRRALPAAGMIPGLWMVFLSGPLQPVTNYWTAVPYIETDKVPVIVQLSGGNDGLN